jgi:hypothetical protein
MTHNRNTTKLHVPEMTKLAHEELSRVQGGARPCKDLNDTGCYSLVTLECRVLASTTSFAA